MLFLVYFAEMLVTGLMISGVGEIDGVGDAEGSVVTAGSAASVVTSGVSAAAAFTG